MYASSTTTTPFHVGCSSTARMSSFLIREPVGLPGEQMYINFIVAASGEVRVERIEGTSRPNDGAGNKGILTRPMSFTCADTEYMPYVGGQTRILSRPGTQKQRSRASIASSLPTPTKRFSGVRDFGVWMWVLRRFMRSCLRGVWWGSGYRCKLRKSIDGSVDFEEELGSEESESEGPYAFSLASRRMLVPSSL